MGTGHQISLCLSLFHLSVCLCSISLPVFVLSLCLSLFYLSVCLCSISLSVFVPSLCLPLFHLYVCLCSISLRHCISKLTRCFPLFVSLSPSINTCLGPSLGLFYLSLSNALLPYRLSSFMCLTLSSLHFLTESHHHVTCFLCLFHSSVYFIS